MYNPVVYIYSQHSEAIILSNSRIKYVDLID